MMLAWFSSSETMWSSGVRIAETVPALAAKPDWNTTQASTLLNAAMRSSSCDVQAHGAGDGADRARTDAVLLHGLDGRFPQLGMGRQAEVIVGCEVDHLFAVKARLRGALRFQDAQALVGALAMQLFELIVKVGERITHQPSV